MKTLQKAHFCLLTYHKTFYLITKLLHKSTMAFYLTSIVIFSGYFDDLNPTIKSQNEGPNVR